MDPAGTDPRPAHARSRSNTAASNKSRKRPLSRASTTSVHSGPLPASLEHQIVGQAAEFNWFQQNAHAHQPRFGDMNHQMTPEETIINSASQLQNPRNNYEIDPALGGGPQHPLTYAPTEVQYKMENARQSMPADPYGGNYGELDGHVPERSDEQDDIDSVAGGSAPAKKASKSSAANELEMRQLFHANKHRSLPEVATELHGNERGPQSERQRQTFAMLWIFEVCAIGKGSVPRGRVYAAYVSRCATERVTVLNPASFGKLVRVLFPGLKTRRLGVRGESKYHYVNFSLKDDQPEVTAAQKQQPVDNFVPTDSFATTFNNSMISQAQYPVDRAAFPSPEIPQISEASKAQRSEGFVRPHSLYHQPDIHNLAQLESTTSKTPQRLRFAPLSDPSQDYPSLTLPKIGSHVPAGTDQDSVSSLEALYRSHCTSLVDALRFCKEKTFFHLFTSFHGTLTMPVQKLFANPRVAPWIEECDFLMYQNMMRVVAPLTLQVAPKPVLDTLRNIAMGLVSHIQNAFHSHPNHVVQAKVAPATLFAGLLDRELRVNLTAHAAANMLSNPANRDQMYEDWITQIRTRKIAECVPTRGMDDVVTLLLTELRDLLNPVAVPWEVEGLTPYGQMAMRTGRQQEANIHADNTTENVLDRWVNFLLSLPGKFPYATHAEIVDCVQQVGTAVMRDITIAQGKSFGSWWVTKCWIDEMIAFMAEQGGFMEYKTSQTTHSEQGPQTAPSRATSHHESRYSSASDEFLQDNGHFGENSATSRPMDVTSQAAINAAAGHDDSGISMPTPEDDFSMEKYQYIHNGPSVTAPSDTNHSLSFSQH